MVHTIASDGDFDYLYGNNISNITTMARPIKETPVLEGKDAKVFYKNLSSVKPVKNEVKERMKMNYEKMKALGLK